MASELGETAAHGTNGVSAPSASDLRSEILAEAASLAKPAAPIKPAPAAGADDPDDAEQVETAAQDEAVDEPEADAEEEVDAAADEDEEAEETSDDPATQKRIDSVRKAEQRSRAKLAEDRQAFDGERKKHEERIARADNFEAAQRRAKYDPASLLRAAGLTEDDFELAAHAIYAESKAAAADPKRKEAAAQRLREREKEDKFTALERKQAELEKTIEEQKEAAKAQQATARYVADLEAGAKKHPLVARILKADPDDAHAGISAAYERLGKKTGKTPSPAAVLVEYDRTMRSKLQKLGIDPDSIAKATPIVTTKKPGAKPVAAAQAANGNVSKTPTREEILAELRAGPTDD